MIRKEYGFRVLFTDIVGAQPFPGGLKSPDLELLPRVILKVTPVESNHPAMKSKAESGIRSDNSPLRAWTTESGMTFLSIIAG